MYEYRAFVRKVYDGDTITVDLDLGFEIVLKNQKLRLARINAPEVRGKQRESGLRSRDFLRDRIGNKWIIVKTMKDKKGKYGRWIADIFFDGECINDQLLAENLAKPYGKEG